MFLDVALSIGHIMKTEYKKNNPYLWAKKQFNLQYQSSNPNSIQKKDEKLSNSEQNALLLTVNHKIL